MALRVWLPLTGTLENKGISNHTIALTDGNTWTSPGKIGNNALTLTKLLLIVPSTSCMSGAKEISYAYWVKVNTAWSANWLDGIRWIETDGSATSTARQEFYTNCTLIGTWYNGGAINGKTFTPGVWTHLAGTFNYNTGEAKFYINGVLSGSTTNVNTAYYCRGDFCIGDNGTDICENDVRIYDHCLSAAEVHEISLGLILHYKLDNNGHCNLFTSDASRTATIASDATSNYTSYTYIDTSIKENGILKEGTEYTITYDYTVNSLTTGTSVYFYSLLNTSLCVPAANLTEIRNGVTSGHRIETFRATAALASYSSTFRVRWRLNTGTAGDSITISNMRFYLGRPEEINYVSDCSGYNHNGTITGNIQIMNNSAHYNNCIYSTNGGVNYIQTPTLNMPTDAITLNIWFKTTSNTPTSDYHMVVDSVGNSSGRLHYEMAIYKTGYFRGGLYVNGTRYADNCTSTTGCNGNWHMLTLTYDGTTIKRYFDKNMEKSTSVTISSGLLPTATLRLFKDGYSSYACINASISDFRIYCTALSTDDIKALYEVSAKADNLHNFHSYEFIENSSKISITKTGQVKNNEINEISTIKLYQSTNNINANEFIEI